MLYRLSMFLRILLFLFFSISLLPSTSFAEEEEEKPNPTNTKRKILNDSVFGVKILGSNYIVGPREEISLLLVTDGKIDIYGKVNKLIVFDGEVIFHEGSSVVDSIILLGGELEKKEGAVIPKGAIKYESDGDFFLSFINFGKILYAYIYERGFVFLYELIYHLLLVVFSHFFIPKFIFNSAERFRQRPIFCSFFFLNVLLISLFLGILLSISFLILAAPLIVFLLIPFIIFLALLFYFFLYPIAAVVVARFLSDRIAEFTKKSSMKDSFSFLCIGMVLFLIFVHLWFVGFFFRIMQFIAIGAVFLQLFYSFGKEKVSSNTS